MDVNLALSLLIALLNEANTLGNSINKAKSEGRADLTDEEVAAFAGRDDAARARLQAKIDALPKS